jgi:hypothetical protein
VKYLAPEHRWIQRITKHPQDGSNWRLSMKKIITFLTMLIAVTAAAVGPIPGGVKITWTKRGSEFSYAVWKMTAPSTNWSQLGITLTTNWTQFGDFDNTTKFAVTALTAEGNAVDVGIAHWPPSPGEPPRTVKVVPTGGYVVDPNKWVKVSSDLQTYDDWMRFSVVTNGIKVEHRTSPAKPYLFMTYPLTAAPPAPPAAIKPPPLP